MHMITALLVISIILAKKNQKYLEQEWKQSMENV